MTGPIAPRHDLDWSPRAPRAARVLLRAAVDDWPQAQGIADDASIVVSELVTNAVTHGRPPVSVAFALVTGATGDQEALRIEVRDAGSDGEPALRTAGPDEEAGRGLALVDGLVSRWGCARDGTVTVVWAELDLR